jgi:hypothetical protein
MTATKALLVIDMLKGSFSEASKNLIDYKKAISGESVLNIVVLDHGYLPGRFAAK